MKSALISKMFYKIGLCNGIIRKRATISAAKIKYRDREIKKVGQVGQRETHTK
jgi:hypothetical protein